MTTFSNQVDVFVTHAMDGMDEHFRIVLMQLYRNIVDGCERDTGTLKNSWGFGKSVSSWEPEKRKYPEGAEAAMIMNTVMKAEKIDATNTVFIFSNLEYALAQERGLGPGNRIPVRMVERAVELMKANASK